jgi:NAD-dependent deacetylase|tara:strand:- start:371 stop:1096 length:726 start_codon:yes stop_codon:yes gene_type:complete
MKADSSIDIVPIKLNEYKKVVFFTGAGMSKESGIPTYRGKGGTWEEYNYKDYACESAFKKNPDHVLDFHELRRKEAKSCEPHVGHQVVSSVEKNHSDVTIVTQNIDGMHQRAGSNNVIELHGSLWRVRCGCSGTREDMGETYEYRKCPKCSNWLRPDIIWFEDMLDHEVYTKATDIISNSDLFISIGTSALVYPAAGLPMTAKMNGARCIEINIDQTEISTLYHDNMIGKAGDILPKLFPI